MFIKATQSFPYARLVLAAALMLSAACDRAPLTAPVLPPQSVSAVSMNPVFDVAPGPQVFTSGSNVRTWDAILPSAAYPNWGTTVCTAQPLVGLGANWQNEHDAYVLTGHPWANDYFTAPWINSWNSLPSIGPGGHNWTKYRTQVNGNGSFVIRLLADNCSWVYLDGTLVGVQGTNLAANSYGLTMNGAHTLEFIIFDGGGAAGGKFRLETTTTPPPPLNPDLDGDGCLNDVDAFPLDPTRCVADNTPPQVTPVYSGQLGANGWYTGTVTITWQIEDNESLVTSAPCPQVVVTDNTNGQTFNCTATSEGGTANATADVKKDDSAPVVSYTGNLGIYTVDQTVSIACSASDAASGLASSTCAPISGRAYSFGAGSHTYSATATDNAGNTSSASTTFVVQATAASMCTLTREFVTGPGEQGVENSLCGKLEKSKYDQFISEVRAQSGKKISVANANILITLASGM